MYDFHIHTSYSSDGQYKPEQILEMARQQGLTGLAFADHMDISAAVQGKALAPKYGLDFFTGVEISTTLSGKEYHLLVYGFKPDNPLITDFLEQHRHAAWDKAVEALDIFKAKGFDIEKEDVAQWGYSVPTGVSILDALILRNSKDARLEAYITGSKSKSPYLNFYKDFIRDDIGAIICSGLPDLMETIRLLKGAGILILAHPHNASPGFLAELKHEGLDGIEVYSTHHTREMISHLENEARLQGFLVSAGSDYHGEARKPDIHLGQMDYQPDHRLIEILKVSGGEGI